MNVTLARVLPRVPALESALRSTGSQSPPRKAPLDSAIPPHLLSGHSINQSELVASSRIAALT